MNPTFELQKIAESGNTVHFQTLDGLIKEKETVMRELEPWWICSTVYNGLPPNKLYKDTLTREVKDGVIVYTAYTDKGETETFVTDEKGMVNGLRFAKKENNRSDFDARSLLTQHYTDYREIYGTVLYILTYYPVASPEKSVQIVHLHGVAPTESDNINQFAFHELLGHNGKGLPITGSKIYRLPFEDGKIYGLFRDLVIAENVRNHLVAGRVRRDISTYRPDPHPEVPVHLNLYSAHLTFSDRFYVRSLSIPGQRKFLECRAISPIQNINGIRAAFFETNYHYKFAVKADVEKGVFENLSLVETQTS